MKKKWIFILLSCSLLLISMIFICIKETDMKDMHQTIEEQKSKKTPISDANTEKSIILEFAGFDKLEPEFAKGQIKSLRRLMTAYLEEYGKEGLNGLVTYQSSKTEYKDQQNILLHFTIFSTTGEEELKVYYDMLQDVFSFTENKIIMKEE